MLILGNKNPRLNMLGVLQNLGPEGRTRTDTSSLTADFESAASTNFTTSGVDDGYITLFQKLVNAEKHICLILKQFLFFVL